MDDKTNKQNPKPGWSQILHGNVLMMGLVSFFTDISSEMIYPLLPVFLTGLVPVGAVAIYIGLIEGISESVANLLKIFSGRFSDVIKKRKMLTVLGYGISTLFRPAMALAASGLHIVAFRFADRVGKGIRTSPRDALISDSVDPSVRGLAFSFHRAMDHAGAVLGPVISILVIYAFWGRALGQDRSAIASPEEMHTLRWLFGASLIPGLFAMVMLILKVREIAPPSAGIVPSKSDITGNDYRRLSARFYCYLAIVAIFTLGNSSDLFLVYYAKTKFDLSLIHLIGLWILLHISKILFSLPGGFLSDKLGRRFAIVTGWILYATVYLGMAVVGKLGFFVLLIFVYGAYYGLTEGAERAMVADFVPSDRRGKAYGLYHGAVGLAALPASLLFGFLWSRFGPQLSFTIGAILAGIATLLFLVFIANCSNQSK